MFGSSRLPRMNFYNWIKRRIPQSIKGLVFGLISWMLFSPFSANSQSDLQIQDPRDSTVYKVVEIGRLKWFQDNLKFQTVLSYFPRLSDDPSKIKEGNFYPYQELDTVCPPGWRIPNQQEWQQYVQERLQSQKGAMEALQVDTLKGEYLAISYTDTSEKVSLFSDENPINLGPFGWIEGKRRKNKETTTIWVRHTDLEDQRFHMHISDHRYIFHTHQHHIDDVPRRSRMFMVKCVSDK